MRTSHRSAAWCSQGHAWQLVTAGLDGKVCLPMLVCLRLRLRLRLCLCLCLCLSVSVWCRGPFAPRWQVPGR